MAVGWQQTSASAHRTSGRTTIPRAESPHRRRQMRSWRVPPRAIVTLRTIAPNTLLCPTKLSEFVGPKRRLFDGEELVELRRRHGCARQHRMGLPAMVDLMLEQVHQQAIA